MPTWFAHFSLLWQFSWYRKLCIVGASCCYQLLPYLGSQIVYKSASLKKSKFACCSSLSWLSFDNAVFGHMAAIFCKSKLLSWENSDGPILCLDTIHENDTKRHLPCEAVISSQEEIKDLQEMQMKYEITLINLIRCIYYIKGNRKRQMIPPPLSSFSFQHQG